MSQAQVQQQVGDKYKENLTRIESNRLAREVLMYMKHPDEYTLDLNDQQLAKGLEALVKTDLKVHNINLSDYGIYLVVSYYARNREALPIYVLDQTFNLESVEKALDEKTLEYFNDSEVYGRFKGDLEKMIRQNTPPANLEDMLTGFNQEFEKTRDDAKLVYNLMSRITG